MSSRAEEYYRRQNGLYGMGIPGGLAAPLFTEGPELVGVHGSMARPVQDFCKQVQPVEPLLLAAGVAVSQEDGNLRPSEQRQDMQWLPRSGKYAPIGTFALRQIKSFAAELAREGAQAMELRAIYPPDIPADLFQRITGHWSFLSERRFVPSQALVMAEGMGAAACGSYLTLIQAVHTTHYTPNAPGECKEYLTPRYSGARLNPMETQAVLAARTPA